MTEAGPTEAGYHAIEALPRCPKEYQFAKIRGLFQPKTETPEALAVGLLFHAGRARWFSLNFETSEKAWLSIKQAVEEEGERQHLPVSMGAERRALGLLNAFVAHWQMRPRPTPVAAEYKIGPAPLDPGDPFFFWRTARLDDVSRYPEGGNNLWIGESKTTSDDISSCISEYELHGQPMLQMVLWHTAPQGEKLHGPVAGVMLDVVKKPYGDDRPKFARQALPISSYAVEWFIKDLRSYLREAAGIEWDSDVRRNFTACTRMIGRKRVSCRFKELCRFGEAAAGNYLLPGGKSLRDQQAWKGTVPPWL